MRCWFAVTAICVTLLIATCGSIEIAGHQSDNTDIIPDLGTCEGMACYLGIVPGRTMVIEARKRIRENAQLVVSEPDLNFAYRTARPYERVQLLPLDQAIGSIELAWLNGMYINAGELVLQFGPPCAVSTLPGDLLLVYPGKVLIFPVMNSKAAARLDPWLPVIQANILDNGLTACGGSGLRSSYQPWRGFGLYR